MSSPEKEKRSGISKLIPPKKWQLPVAILLGIFFGLAATSFHISRASSYLSDDASACVNCHIMTPHYATWQHSSHRENATCNDCHVPHDNVVRKYFFKAKDGMRHAAVFTMRNEAQVIRLNEEAKDVVQQNCLRCHNDQMIRVSASNVTGENYKHGEGKLCWDCHREVPHGRVSSQSSTPYARVPKLENAVPAWLQKD